jgi:hypothetical protein
MSFVERAHKIRVRYLNLLNRHFKEFADKKEEESFNMLEKTEKIFSFQDYT